MPYRNLQRNTPIVFNLIIINAVVFIAQLVLDKSMPVRDCLVGVPGAELIGLTQWIGLWHYSSPCFEPYQLVTHMFAHGNFFHILFNMYALFILGTVLEKVWGPKKFFIFYMVCGLAAGISQMMLVKYSFAIGASGAIMGLFAAFAYMFPNVKFFILPFPFPIKAKYMVAFMVLIDLFGGLHPGSADNVAHFAHLGGMVMGFILVLTWGNNRNQTYY
jgi:membrane associated rhomboid family serine protease